MTDFVTRDEFKLVYEVVRETQLDVKVLLAAKAADDAVKAEHNKRSDRRTMVRPTLIATVFSAATATLLHFF